MANRIVETVWDCPDCKTKGIRGRNMSCPNCGKKRGENTKFYLPKGNLTYLDKPFDDGPDWYCHYCNTYNRSSRQTCSSCGAPKGSKNYFDVLKEQGRTADLERDKSGKEYNPPSESKYSFDDSSSFKSSYSGSSETIKEKSESYSNPYRSNSSSSYESSSSSYSSTNRDSNSYSNVKTNYPSEKKSFGNAMSSVGEFVSDACSSAVGFVQDYWRGILIFLGIGLFIFLMAFLLTPKKKTITVDNLYWTRSIEIEENRLVKDSGWNVPTNAVEVYDQRQEIHHYNHVIDHYTTVTEQKSRQVYDGDDVYYTYQDLGNGSAVEVEHRTPRYRTEYYTETHEEPVYRDDPVYQTKYYYTIWRYVYDHTETSSGYMTLGNMQEPAWPTYTLKEKQRSGHRSEEYVVNATCKDEKVQYTVDYDLWKQFVPTEVYKVKVQFGKVIEIVNDNDD